LLRIRSVREKDAEPKRRLQRGAKDKPKIIERVSMIATPERRSARLIASLAAAISVPFTAAVSK